MKNRARLTIEEVARARRIARITKAGHLAVRLKKLLTEISEKDMEGSEPQAVIEACERLEAAFAEYRAEYVMLYKSFGERLGKDFPNV